MNIHLDPMHYADLESVMKIQEKVYRPDFHEAVAVFANKYNFYPQGCWVARQDQEVVAYIFSHPWIVSMPPQLDTCLTPHSVLPNCYYIHDVAVSQAFHVKGLGQLLFQKAKKLAQQAGLNQMAAIAVQESTTYWEKFVFQPVTKLNSAMEEKLASYGKGACFMVNYIYLSNQAFFLT